MARCDIGSLCWCTSLLNIFCTICSNCCCLCTCTVYLLCKDFVLVNDHLVITAIL